jgi:hypothetical protein
MGVFSKKVAASEVEFAGILDYSESGDEEVTISARLEVSQRDRLGGKEPLPMLGSLGAARLLSMLRREPDFVVPFMGPVRSLAEGRSHPQLAGPTETFVVSS